MPDIIQESYEVLNQYLGETNNRNLKRLPEKYELLLKAVQNLVSYAHQMGVAEGRNQKDIEICKLLKQFDQPSRYPKYKSLEAAKENETR